MSEDLCRDALAGPVASAIQSLTPEYHVGNRTVDSVIDEAIYKSVIVELIRWCSEKSGRGIEASCLEISTRYIAEWFRAIIGDALKNIILESEG